MLTQPPLVNDCRLSAEGGAVEKKKKKARGSFLSLSLFPTRLRLLLVACSEAFINTILSLGFPLLEK